MAKRRAERKRLTGRTVGAIRATGREREIVDTVVPQMRIRVREGGSRSYVLLTRYPGSTNPTRRTIAPVLAASTEKERNEDLTAARKKAREWLELIERGIDPAVQAERERLAEQRRQAGTFASVAEAFIADKLSTERRGDDAKRQIEGELLPRWGKRPITDIDATDVKAMLREVKQRAPYMAHALLATTRRLWNWAIEQGDYGLTSSPCDHIAAKSLIGERKPRLRVLSDDEIRVLWRAISRMPYPYGPLARVLLLTGMRHDEAAGARWGEIDLTNKRWTIPVERHKSETGHLVPLADEVVAILKDLPRWKGADHLFSTTAGEKPTWIGDKIKKRLDARMLRTLKAMARMRGEDPRRIELKPWRIHDIRRTMRTHLSALRIPDHIAEMVLGHGRKGLQRVYDQHRYEDEMRDALERWAARLRSIVEPPAANVVKLKSRA